MKCSETKPVSPETWPYRKSRGGEYAAFGGVCKVCEAKRKQEYEERRDKIKALVKTEPPAPETVKPGDKAKPTKLDVSTALKAGSRVLNEYAPSVLARVLEYAEDPDSEHHQWALELLATRVMPKKLYEDLGSQAAGVGGLSDKRPMYVINVLPATPGDSARVIEGEVIPPQLTEE